MTAFMMGMKQLAFAAVTNPATGYATTLDYKHDGEEVLEYAKKAHEGLIKTIFKIIERTELQDKPKKLDNCLKMFHKALNIKHVECALS